MRDIGFNFILKIYYNRDNKGVDMNILTVKENNFNKDFPLLDLASIGICWEFIIASANIEDLYQMTEDHRDMGALDASLTWKQQVRSMIHDLQYDHNPYARLAYFLPIPTHSKTVSFKQDMARRLVIIRGRYYGLRTLRKPFEC